jgi:hypothetical protein
MEELINELQFVCQSHKLVKTFKYGNLADINDANTEYPLVFLEFDETFVSNSTTFKFERTQSYSFDVYVLTFSDHINLDEPTNLINSALNQEALSVITCENIAKQLVWKIHQRFDDRLNKYVEPTEWFIIPVLRQYVDDLNGVRLRMTVNVYREFCNYEDAFMDQALSGTNEYKDNY